MLKAGFFLKSFARPAASTTTSLKHGRHGLSEAWLYSFSTHHMVYGILFTTLLSVRLGPGFKPLLRRSRMSFPAGPLASFCCVISLALVSLLPGCLQRSVRSRFESPSRPSRISQRHKFFSPEQASRFSQKFFFFDQMTWW